MLDYPRPHFVLYCMSVSKVFLTYFIDELSNDNHEGWGFSIKDWANDLHPGAVLW